VRRVLAENEPTLEAPAVDERLRNEHKLADLLAEVRAAREALVELLANAPADGWERTGILPDGERRAVHELARDIVQRDAEQLRTLAYRLHESHLTDRSEDLPK
jgi:hypothetical protein